MLDLTAVKMIDRPRMFRTMLAQKMAILGEQFWVRGPKGNDGGWGHGANRRRVRALARKMAREEMRKVRMR